MKRRPPPKPRNPVARSPLLAKGGAHVVTQKAKRRRARVALRDELRRVDADEGKD